MFVIVRDKTFSDFISPYFCMLPPLYDQKEQTKNKRQISSNSWSTDGEHSTHTRRVLSRNKSATSETVLLDGSFFNGLVQKKRQIPHQVSFRTHKTDFVPYVFCLKSITKLETTLRCPYTKYSSYTVLKFGQTFRPKVIVIKTVDV